MPDGTVIDFIRGFGERKREHQINEVLKNYLTDPEGAIRAVNQIDAPTGIALARKHQEDVDAQEKAALEQRTRHLTGLHNMAGMLREARDKGADLGAAYDSITPILRSGFGLDDGEIADWRGRILQDPNIIDYLSDSAEDELKLVAPGAALVRGGKEVYRNPTKSDVIQVRRGDGGTDVLVYDPETKTFIPAGQGAPTGVGTTGAAGSGWNGQPKTVDPTSRGIRNNNPLNLEASPWTQGQPGFLNSDGRFARFASAAQGNAAADRLIGRKVASGLNTPAKLIESWTPVKENGARTGQYIDYVAGRLGIGRDDVIPLNRLGDLRTAMTEFENGGGGGGAATAAYSTPGKPDELGWEVLTRDQKLKLGLDPNVNYRRGLDGPNKGKVEPIGPSAGRAGLKVSEDELNRRKSSTIANLRRLRSEAMGISGHPSFDQATGSIQGRLPSVFQGTVNFDDKLSAFRDQVVLDTIQSLKQLSATGATGFGNLTEREGARLENSKGSLHQTSPVELRKTLNRVAFDSAVTIGYIELDGNVPREAIEMLVKNPKLAPQFEQKFGKGTAAQALSGAR